jgi:N-acetylmuramoyl-L-alanine amidase
VPEKYKIRKGDCLSSIAARYKIPPDKLWQDSGNQALREKRKDPNVLHPGDEIVIPDLETKQESIGTESKHRFCRKGTITYLRLRLLDDEHEPLSRIPYRLEIDGKLCEGSTDGDGYLEEKIDADGKKAVLYFEEEEEKLRYEFALGDVDPIDEVSGAQSRLANLGYYDGEVDGELGPRTRTALRFFQKKFELELTEETDDDTLQKLEEVHGS